ncbi:prepilin-type N-terminal cleavage/methylation domain-containing protein [Metabacillus fastidiosus]|uniref:PilW family protein n=1 Tax=Metabacillus fastidiosus TaxID=1458 RepID=UPI002DBA4DF7|nr:prepilin-type N-terminal cleavage/methylation domain-containing protein [Metabacillus fastidiosus]MEC2076796.1 prepilin-type N-terminal cleavage/methylation domain-containing protein [Metabacillus fastidiosus]
MKNEKGLTLVEVLVGLAILSTIMVILGGLLIDGFRHSEKAENITALQQEANLIIRELNNVHRKYDSYTIDFSKNPIIVDYTKDSFEIPLNSRYIYTFCKATEANSNPDLQEETCEDENILTITKSKNLNNLPIILEIKYTNKKDPIYIIRTTLSRLGG